MAFVKYCFINRGPSSLLFYNQNTWWKESWSSGM